jgi:hypothetical protein
VFIEDLLLTAGQEVSGRQVTPGAVQAHAVAVVEEALDNPKHFSSRRVG